MELHELVRRARLEPLETIDEADGHVEVIDITHDSRRIAPGAMFAAVPGTRFDGHDHAPDAVDRGASAVLVERPLRLGVPDVVVGDVRRDMGRAAAAVWGHPADLMTTVGVTGTAGKTTTTHLVAGVLEATGARPEVIGTISGALTTPESTDLHRQLAEARLQGRDAVAMEVSSHALTLHRTEGVRFDVAVFTNLGVDHLDFHDDMEDYFRAKRLLFDTSRCAVGVVCVDDEWGRRLLDDTDPSLAPRRGYSLDEATALSMTAAGSTFTWRGHDVRVHLPGRFNVRNALAALHVADVLELDLADAVAGIADVEQVRGRFESVLVDGADIDVVVDYSHKPGALEAMLAAAREVARGSVVVVFGAGGDRDKTKRPQMGAVATAAADRVIVTSDNPRSEDPQTIIDEIVAGCDPDASVTVEADRARAIALAIAQAAPGDLVVIAGKGHETTQKIGDRTLPFDDAEHGRRELRRRVALGQPSTTTEGDGA